MRYETALAGRPQAAFPLPLGTGADFASELGWALWGDRSPSQDGREIGV
jgi:diacylglycerol kinase family enzyme